MNFDFLNAIAANKDGNEKIKTCIQCGSCTASCVALDGMSLSPRKLWRDLQMGMKAELMGSMSFWNCTTCSLCDKRCPRAIPLSHIMLRLREEYSSDGSSIAGISQTLDNLQKSRNIMGEESGNRFLWIDNLGLPEKDRSNLFKEKSELVYFTGCVGALFPQVGGIPQSLVKLLIHLKTDFSLLKDEWCCGYPIMAGGKGQMSLREYAEHNIAAIENKGAKTIIVSCPTCYYIFNKVYPELLEKPFSFKVMHYAEYLESSLAIKGSGKGVVVTYHDPCDLGRKLNITGAPRNILKNLEGVTLCEMRFSGAEGKCCGGGGNLEMVNPELSLKIATKRIGDAMETGAEYLLSSCQQCKRTLQNATRKSRSRIKVMDLLEFLLQRLEEAPLEKTPPETASKEDASK